MDIHLASERLAALSASARRPKIAQLRDLFDKVETAVRSGVRYADIIQTLAECGLHFTYPSFAAALKRIRRERGLVPRHSPSRHPGTGPAANRTPAPGNDAKPAPEVLRAPPVVRERHPIAPAGTKLPEDWLTAELTREQKRLLTPEQRSARADAKVKQYWPNPFDPVPPKRTTPPKGAS